MNTTMSILYREIAGAGTDDECSEPDGVKVVLSHWESPDTWNVPDHYLLYSVVLLDRKIAVEKFEVVKGYSYDDARMIREAIKLFDHLVEKHLIDKVGQ
jgi:hypothetical protein